MQMEHGALIGILSHFELKNVSNWLSLKRRGLPIGQRNDTGRPKAGIGFSLLTSDLPGLGVEWLRVMRLHAIVNPIIMLSLVHNMGCHVSNRVITT